MISFKNSSLVALLGLAVFIVNCQGEDAPFMQWDKNPGFDKCLAEAGLTKDDLKGMHEDPPKEPSTKELCLAKCLAKSGGFLQDDGTVNSELVKKSVPPAIDAATVSKMVKCMEDAGKVTTCDDMSKVMKCIPKPLKD